MKLNEMTYTEGARRESKRIGRGHGSGNGKTAGKGHKGQNARSGGGVREVSKVDKHHYQDVYQNVDLLTSTVKNMQSLTLKV